MTARISLAGFSMSSATISGDQKYRYALTRRWAPDGQMVAFVMLNPSTADGQTDDPTIRRCIGFARAWGYSGLLVVNLFALRSTSPAGVWAHPRPTGERPDDNDQEIIDALERERPDIVVAAWGAWEARVFRLRERHILKTFPRPLYHLGLTKDGHPKHPLYLRGDVRPTLWERPQ